MDTLHDPAVRDLAWVIGAPGLLEAATPPYQGRVVDDAWCSAQLQNCTSWLQALDRSPQPLHQYIATRATRRLGHYFETLIIFWLSHNADTHIIATNLQVQDELRTLGEYDLLFRDVDGKITHWEAAVKFYLQQEPVAEQHAFIGPGTRDRLDLKLDRVFQHQLLLGESAAGQQALPPGIRLDRARAFIKGYLFYHASSPAGSAVPGISAKHLRGWWARHTLDNLPQVSSESRWTLLPRLSWLAPARLHAGAEVMTCEALNTRLDTHFSTSPDAVLLFEMQQSQTGLWEEISRGFVVCKTWPIIDTISHN